MKRLPIYLLLDVSGSMSGSPIESVNKGIELLVSSLKAEPQAKDCACISVITYASEARQVRPLTSLDQFLAPSLSASGGTNLSRALDLASEKMKSEVVAGTDYYPLVFIMTDGDVGSVKGSLESFNKNKMGIVVACAAGSGANVEALKEVTPFVIRLDNAGQATISSFFKWISDSVASGNMKVEKAGAAIAGLKNLPSDIHVESLPKPAEGAKKLSFGLDAMIKAAIVDGYVTDKERAILIKKAVSEGYDEDEFSLILDAQIFEMNNKK